MLKPELITPPAQKVLSLDQVKAHCRVDHNDDDTLLERLIDVVTSYLDGYSGILRRCLINQTWRQKLCDWPQGSVIYLPLSSVSEVSIRYTDSNGSEQSVNDEEYKILDDHCSSFIYFKDSFSRPQLSDEASIDFVSGYGPTSEAVPDAIKHAMLLLIGHYYENREASMVGVSVTDLPMGVNALLNPFRRLKL